MGTCRTGGDRQALDLLQLLGQRTVAIAVPGRTLFTSLATQAEQAMLANGQAETGKGQRIDLLLLQAGRQLGVEGDVGRDLSAGGTGINTVASTQIGVVRPNETVLKVLAGLDVDIATRLEDRRVSFPSAAGLIDLTTLQILPLHHADETIQVLFQSGQLRGWGMPGIEGGRGIGVVVVAGFATRYENAGGFDLAGLDAFVLERREIRGEVAARADQAAVVEQLLAAQEHVAPSHEVRCRAAVDDFQFVPFDHLPDTDTAAVTTQVAIASGIVGAATGQFGNDGAVLADIVDDQYVSGVVDDRAPKAEIAHGLQGSRQVVEPVGLSALVILRQVHIPQAVHIRKPVGEAVHPQRHVAAAEDQAIFVAQGRCVEPESLGATQGAMVVQGGGAQGQVVVGGECAAIGQQARGADVGQPAPGDAGAARQVDAGSREGQVAQAGEATAAVVGAGQGQVEAAVAGDQALVGPFAARGAQALGRQQPTAGGLVEGADI